MIFLSVGHNKDKQGASYSNNGFTVTEFMLAEKWIELIALLLKEKCVRVPRGTLTEKVKFINDGVNSSKGNHIAIELHFNSFKKWIDLDKDGVVDSNEMIALGKGAETLYMPGSAKGKEFADLVQSQLGHLMKPNRGIKEGWYQMNPKKGADYFLKATRCPAIIVEPEFIDNIEQINQNMSPACHVIAAALLEYSQQNI